MEQEIREILVEHSDNKNSNDRIMSDLLGLFEYVYVLILHYNENDNPYTEFEGVYLNEVDAENSGNTINKHDGKLNIGKTSYDDPIWVGSNEVAFSVVKTKIL